MNEPMTTQQIFNKVCVHLLTQGDKAMVGSSCRYRAPNGLSCAVGCLIKDEHYDEGIEGDASTDAGAEYAVTESIGRSLLVSERELLSRLQAIHDCDSLDEWPEELERAAHRWSLKWEVDETLIKSFENRIQSRGTAA